MSHEKLKNIRVDRKNMVVRFMGKSNNCTEDYRENSCSIPDFLHLSWGNCFQYSNKALNEITKSLIEAIKKMGFNESELWFNYEDGHFDEWNPELRITFSRHCDMINNL
jgi:hypothetical protein